MTEIASAPPLDALAAHRWQALLHRQASGQSGAPWLHEEVGQRMVERLSWIKREPSSWVNWRALSAGVATHQKITALYPKSQSLLAPAGTNTADNAIKLVVNGGAKPTFFQALRQKIMPSSPSLTAVGDGAELADGVAQMVWANMSLHAEPDPAAAVAAWHRLLAVDGYLMFSCLGPDTALELREIYAAQGYGVAAHPLTDMHDWGDLLVRSGFAEPVMDMERIVLTFSTAERAVDELRGIGRNLHPQRFAGLRTPAWRECLYAQLQNRADAQGQIALTFEVIYGHAFKPVPRVKMASESAISMRDMRQMLASGRA